MVEPLSLNFRVLTVKSVGVRKFRHITVIIQSINLFESHIQGIIHVRLIEPCREKTGFLHNMRKQRRTDQLRGNREADQRLCFRYTDSRIPLLPKSEISSL